MVDFHSHILPGMDDGAENVNVSLRMLRESSVQGVNVIFAAPHYYADRETPTDFLQRRAASYDRLKKAMTRSKLKYLELYLGAEILYFPGMSGTEELKQLTMGETRCLLIELPMSKITDIMLDEIEQVGKNLRCVPVLAHADRYMRLLNDNMLLERLTERKILAQVNADFFLQKSSLPMAIECLRKGQFHFIGSDCHNLTDRAPNMGQAAAAIREAGATRIFADFNKKIYHFLDR
jgi:protein-tyrosine phosphatase